MDELNLFLRICLAYIFVTSFVSKVKNTREHSLIVKNYKILPDPFVSLFTRVNIILEGLIGMLLLIDLLQRFAALAAVIILMVYCIAVVTNLMRGRKDISCGCGGITGVHHLSWWLVFRNLIFILAGVWLFQSGSPWLSLQAILSEKSLNSVYPIQSIKIVLLSILFLILVLIVNNLVSVKKRMNTILSDSAK